MGDLKGIIPQCEYITLVDREKKRLARKDKSIQYEFECELYLPAESSFVLMDEWETIKQIFSGVKLKNTTDIANVAMIIKSKKDETLSLIRRIFASFLSVQYDFMNYDWCVKNIDLKQTFHIVAQIVNPIIEYFQMQGYLQGGVAELVKPGKNPKVDIRH